MKRVLVIGIGPGNPEQITVQAVNALNEVDVFFVVHKRDETAELVRLRREICDRYATTRAHRFVTIADPPRDRTAADYAHAVDEWHVRRVAAYRDAIDTELRDGDTGAFLAWGDPSLYDSTIRILDQLTDVGGEEFEYAVVPGVTSVQALAASHRIPLNGIGEAVHVTTGRKLAAGWPADTENVVVMLDGAHAFADLGDDVDIYWGAYVGTDDEILVHGRLPDVADEIVRQRSEARARKGWIMDTYLLRRHAAPDSGAATE